MPVATKTEKDLETQAATDAAVDIEADAGMEETPTVEADPETLAEQAAWDRTMEGFTEEVKDYVSSVDQKELATLVAKFEVGAKLAEIKGKFIEAHRSKMFMPWAIRATNWEDSTIDNYMSASTTFYASPPERQALQSDKATYTPVEHWAILASVPNAGDREAILQAVEQEVRSQDGIDRGKRKIRVLNKDGVNEEVKLGSSTITRKVRQLALPFKPEQTQEAATNRQTRQNKANLEKAGKVAQEYRTKFLKPLRENLGVAKLIGFGIGIGAASGQEVGQMALAILVQEVREEQKAGTTK